jgi:hypothetical protein
MADRGLRVVIRLLLDTFDLNRDLLLLLDFVFFTLSRLLGNGRWDHLRPHGIASYGVRRLWWRPRRDKGDSTQRWQLFLLPLFTELSECHNRAIGPCLEHAVGPHKFATNLEE